MRSSYDIAIVGMGPAGAYLTYLLRDDDVDVVVFDKKHRSNIGEKCALGTHLPSLLRLFPEDEHEEIEDMVYHRGEEATIQAGYHSTTAELNGFVTFDKNRFLNWMLKQSGATLRDDNEVRVKGTNQIKNMNAYEHDMVVDATGGRRHLLPKRDNVDEDVTLPCYQALCVDMRVNHNFYLEPVGAGYIWEFPLDEGWTLVGCGTDKANPKEVVENHIMGREFVEMSTEGATINLTPPSKSMPFYSDRYIFPVIGVGEAIGTVSPITGEGIVSSMKSSRLLYDRVKEEIDKAIFPSQKLNTTYTHSVLDEFKRYDREYKLVKAVRERKLLKSLWRGLFVPSRKEMDLSFRERYMMMKGGIKYDRSE